MKPALGKPHDCHDLATLSQWVEELQELAMIQRELVDCSRKQVEIGDKLFARLEEKLNLLGRKRLCYRIASQLVCHSLKKSH